MARDGSLSPKGPYIPLIHSERPLHLIVKIKRPPAPGCPLRSFEASLRCRLSSYSPIVSVLSTDGDLRPTPLASVSQALFTIALPRSQADDYLSVQPRSWLSDGSAYTLSRSFTHPANCPSCSHTLSIRTFFNPLLSGESLTCGMAGLLTIENHEN